MNYEKYPLASSVQHKLDFIQDRLKRYYALRDQLPPQTDADEWSHALEYAHNGSPIARDEMSPPVTSEQLQHLDTMQDRIRSYVLAHGTETPYEDDDQTFDSFISYDNNHGTTVNIERTPMSLRGRKMMMRVNHEDFGVIIDSHFPNRLEPTGTLSLHISFDIENDPEHGHNYFTGFFPPPENLSQRDYKLAMYFMAKFLIQENALQ